MSFWHIDEASVLVEETGMSMNTPLFPRKLYVEPATLCNLGCAMCVKHSAGWDCEDALMSRATFEALTPLFPHLDTLNLNGIGESLMHPELAAFIALARAKVPDGCVIGFQSNGMLLTRGLAGELMDAGLDRICFSVDSPDADQLERFRAGAELGQVGQAFELMRGAAGRPGARPLSLGVETVVSAQNYSSLPDMVSWCADRGVDFVIVSHVLPYNASDAPQSLYVPLSRRCLDFYREWEKVFHAEGLDVSHSYTSFYAVFRTPEQQRLVDIILAMKEDAQGRGLQFSLPNAMNVDFERLERVRETFARAMDVAQARGIRLDLPETEAREPRECAFVRDPSLFVAYDGALAPCYYLWHSYSAWLLGSEVRVRQRAFGLVPEDDPLQVWRSGDFVRFRDEAVREEYARCADCSVVPCDHVQGFPAPFAKDCYGQTVPCGVCPWSGGGFACLR
ncbi:radical SAM/SPASM family putative metalloenzyme maturase [Desulfomicrobium macestii]|uniref:radical SAM/SPASM family putative metalloenzyme maturase n=1 Tax=Desulfomicrobium macestii TaxID=90731 RepID=UPI0017899106|nr:radical SAM/SPASM family putative metalloenzyme maturase [Desulfomicrobium macestii]